MPGSHPPTRRPKQLSCSLPKCARQHDPRRKPEAEAHQASQGAPNGGAGAQAIVHSLMGTIRPPRAS